MKFACPFNIPENENDFESDTTDRKILEIVLIDF